MLFPPKFIYCKRHEDFQHCCSFSFLVFLSLPSAMPGDYVHTSPAPGRVTMGFLFRVARSIKTILIVYVAMLPLLPLKRANYIYVYFSLSIYLIFFYFFFLKTVATMATYRTNRLVARSFVLPRTISVATKAATTATKKSIFYL